MKFYQIIVPVILCFIYTTTIFGSEQIIKIPEDLFNLIDKFRAPKKDCFPETGHVEIKDEVHEADDILAVSCFQNFIWLECKRFTPGSYAIQRFLSLSDMKVIEGPKKKIIKGQLPRFYDSSFGEGLLKHDAEELLIVKAEKDAIMNEDNGKLGIFKCMKENAYRRFIPGVSGARYAFREKPDHMCTLEAPEKLNFLSVSEDGKIIVTCGKGGHVRKWELQKRLEEVFKLKNIFPNGEITSSEGGKRVVPTAKYVNYKAVQIIAITGVCYYFFKDFLSELWNKDLFNLKQV